MKIISISVFVFVSLFAATTRSDRTPADWANSEILHTLTYVMDHRVNTCYARFREGGGDWAVGSYTKVDCNDVKPLLVNP